MSSINYTFADLKNEFSSHLAEGLKISPSSFPNMMSALNAFVAERGLSDLNPVGSHLRASFYKARDAHLASLAAEGRTGAYISNRKHLLSRWRSALLAADQRTAAARNDCSPFQAALKEVVAQCGTVKGTARASNVPLATLRRWLLGAVPNGRSLRWVPRLEQHFGLPAGTLGDLVPGKPKRGERGADEEPQQSLEVPYRTRLKERSATPYAVKDPTEQLRAEWAELINFKTSMGEYRRWEDGGKLLHRQKNGQWRTSQEYVEAETASTWYAFRDGEYVPTAAMHWAFVSRFCGWLQLPADVGGMALAEDQAQTLANLANFKYVERFCRWTKGRSGSINGGTTTFLRIVSSYCHPQTGFLTQSFSLLPGGHASDERNWQDKCESSFRAAKALAHDYGKVARLSRDPFAPIQSVLALPNPLDAIVDAIRRMDADRPSTGGVVEALWARDRLLLGLTASNPLRKRNLQLLTYRADGSGQLRWVDGVLRIVIEPSMFKNANGAARKRAYRMAVREELWDEIERYLKVYRPLLAAADNPYFFVSKECPKTPWLSLARHFAKLTKRYMTGCPGFGPHAMRHIVATSILKARPNDWHAAAWALHDQEETVRQNYAHLAADDAARWLDPVMAGPFARLRG